MVEVEVVVVHKNQGNSQVRLVDSPENFNCFTLLLLIVMKAADSFQTPSEYLHVNIGSCCCTKMASF